MKNKGKNKRKKTSLKNRVNLRRRGGKMVGIEKFLAENPPKTVEEIYPEHFKEKQEWTQIESLYPAFAIRAKKLHLLRISRRATPVFICHAYCEYLKIYNEFLRLKLLLIFESYRMKITFNSES